MHFALKIWTINSENCKYFNNKNATSPQKQAVVGEQQHAPGPTFKEDKEGPSLDQGHQVRGHQGEPFQQDKCSRVTEKRD